MNQTPKDEQLIVAVGKLGMFTAGVVASVCVSLLLTGSPWSMAAVAAVALAGGFVFYAICAGLALLMQIERNTRR